MITESLLGPLIDHVVKMYNVNPRNGMKNLTPAKFKAWLGIHFMTYAWKFPVLSRYWNSGTYAGMSIPDFSSIMSYADYIEIRRNLRFEDYRKEGELKPNDKAWKVRSLLNIVRDKFKEINPAPGQMLSLDEGMILYTGNKCPNEKVIDYYLNNNAWKLEKELLASGKRISIRKVVEQSNSFQNVDVNFATHHDMVENTATWSDGRISSYFCAFCQMNPPDEPLTYKHRSKFYCEQCSIFADFTADRVYLHPQCFGKYHRHKYDRIVGSTNVTGVVLGK